MFQSSEPHLAKAGTLLILEFLGTPALGLILGQFGLVPDTALGAAWLLNLITSWYLFKAAQYQKRRAIVYCLFSGLGPPASILTFIRLFSYDRDNFYSAVAKQRRNEV
jgi:hypothetical protein